MSDTTTTTDRPATLGVAPTLMVRAFTALRIFTGLVWLTNGLAKLFGVGNYDLGFFSFNLITLGSAEAIADGAAGRTGITPLATFYQDVVLPNWGLFGTFLTIAELAIGLGLIFGVASRLAAVGGLLLLTPIWVMLWDTGSYLWTYPAEDLFPLALLVIVPAGRHAGFDGRLAARFGNHFPF